VVNAEGGSFTGARLRGRILPTGGDWLLRAPGRSLIDVRLALETDDGVTVLLRYTGKASQRDGQPRLEIAGSFDAPEGPYGWLNDVQAFGLGFVTAEGVAYHFYRFA